MFLKVYCSNVLDKFILTEELFAKDLQSFETCVLVKITENFFHH